MSYHYSNPEHESEPHALPDVEVFESYYDTDTMLPDGPGSIGVLHNRQAPTGFYYAFGFPGCLWDSDPVGPFESYDAALAAAREVASD